MTNIADLLRAAAARWPHHEALVFDATDERLTFAEFDRRTETIARALVAAGVAAGDRVLLCSANVPLFPLAWFGILKAGAVMVPINPRYKLEDAGHLAASTQPKAAFCDSDRLDLVRAIGEGTPSLALIVTDRAGPAPGAVSLGSFMAAAGGEGGARRPVTADNLANIQFTSGTSGLPKGCMLSHGYWLGLAEEVRRSVIALEPGDTMLTAQAFSYLDPQWALVLTIMSGARLVVLDRFSPSRLWAKVVQHDARLFYCLAAMPLMMLSTPAVAEERQHRLGVVMCSGIPADRHAEIEARFGVPWLEAYGSTETGFDLGIGWDDHRAGRGVATIGKPLPGREAQIVDERFEVLGDGEVGELLVRGPSMMAGYWRNPEATDEAFHGDWYRTGDLARRDGDGFYHLVGRRKDMIRRGGENVAAAEVEAVLHQHPAVRLAACVAVPDPVRNEEILVFVVPEGSPDIIDLIDFLDARLAAFKVPRYWRFVDELPMTPSERVAKPMLPRSTEGALDRTLREDKAAAARV